MLTQVCTKDDTRVARRALRSCEAFEFNDRSTRSSRILSVMGDHQPGQAPVTRSLKAQLAFLGLQATVKSAVVGDKTWHRVQLGPFSSQTKLSRAKNLLIENDIKYMQRSAP